jgi:hypothetical protein
MELEERLKQAIQDIAQRQNNVTLDEIGWVMEKLGTRFKVRRRDARHGVLFAIEGSRFMISGHNPGSKQVKACYVSEFLNAMSELGLYDE